MLDEAQREEEGKEPNEAQAEGPAPRSTLHVESCVVERRKQTTTLFALLLAGGEKGVKKMKPGEERARSSRTVPTGLVVRKKKIRNSKIPASSSEVVGETGEGIKRKQVQPFEGWLFIFLGQPEICPYPGLSHLALPHWPIRRLLNWGNSLGSTGWDKKSTETNSVSQLPANLTRLAVLDTCYPWR